MGLPDFKQGGPLTAADLNVLADRLRQLQARAAVPFALGRGVRRVQPGRRFGFELATWNGLVFCRQGWVDVGHGQMYAVGEQEWNEVGRLEACTVWLVMAREAGAVEVTAYDESTPETNLRRRLGYVREEVREDGSVVLHCVQCTGGLICPVAPRRMMGGNEWDAGTPVLAKSNDSMQMLTAGHIQGQPYTQVPGRWYGGCAFSLKYSPGLSVQFAATDGGRRFEQVFSFGGGRHDLHG